MALPSLRPCAHPLHALRRARTLAPDVGPPRSFPSNTPGVNSSQGVINLHTSCLFWSNSKAQKSHGYILPRRKCVDLGRFDPSKPWVSEPLGGGGVGRRGKGGGADMTPRAASGGKARPLGHVFLRCFTSGAHGDFWEVGPSLQKGSSPFCLMVCPQRPPVPRCVPDNTGDSDASH